MMIEPVATTDRGVMSRGPSHDNNDFQQNMF